MPGEAILEAILTTADTQSNSHCSVAMRRHHDQSNYYKKNTFNWKLAYCFRHAVHYHHVRKNCGMQHYVGVVAKNYILIHRKRKRLWAWHELLKPQRLPPVVHFFQQGHILLVPFNSATIWWLRISIYEPIGGILIQTTIIFPCCSNSSLRGEVRGKTHMYKRQMMNLNLWRLKKRGQNKKRNLEN